MADDFLQRFRDFNDFLDRRETRKATSEICEVMDHSSIGCQCFEDLENSENLAPESPDFVIAQPNSKFNGDLENSVPGCFIAPNSSVQKSENPQIKKRKNPEKMRKPYSFKDKKRGNVEQRRVIKKKLFMDLGIIRTNFGIDNEEKNREEAMKRRVTETIVTTYCEECEQNFSSAKMLLLHRNKVHNSTTLECHLCLKRFSQTITFNRHMKCHYGPNAQPHVKCEHCDRQFKDKDSLKVHMEVSHKVLDVKMP